MDTLPTICIPQEIGRCLLLEKMADGTYATETATCFCGSSDSELLSDIDRYHVPSSVHLCVNCGLVYVSPRLTREASHAFYAQEYRMIYQTSTADEATRADTPDEDFAESIGNGERLREILETYDVEVQRVIDIGCNSGGMLKPFQDAGCVVHGVDWDRASVAYGQGQGLPIVVGSPQDLMQAGVTADLVILHHVLEHVHDLRETIEACHQLLTPDGVLWIAVPGIKTTPIRLMFQSAHLWHFTYDTLEYVMNCCGFSQLYCSEGVQSLWRYTGVYRKTSAVHPTALNDILNRMGRDPDVVQEVKVVSKFPLAIQRANIEAVLQYGLPDFTTIKDRELGREAIIVSGGPSIDGQVEEIMRLLSRGCKVVAIEKMNDWCLQHGIIPDYILATDASDDVADSLAGVRSGTVAIVATLCGPRAVEHLAGRTVVLINAATDLLDLREMTQRHGYFPSTICNMGGSVSLGAMSVAMALGMKRLHIFGFDCHMTEHAYANGISGVGPAYQTEWIDLKDATGQVTQSFLTTPPYLAFAQQFFKLCEIGLRLHFLERAKVYGNSLVPAMGADWLRAMNLDGD